MNPRVNFPAYVGYFDLLFTQYVIAYLKEKVETILKKKVPGHDSTFQRDMHIIAKYIPVNYVFAASPKHIFSRNEYLNNS